MQLIIEKSPLLGSIFDPQGKSFLHDHITLAKLHKRVLP